MGPFAGWGIKQFDKSKETPTPFAKGSAQLFCAGPFLWCEGYQVKQEPGTTGFVLGNAPGS